MTRREYADLLQISGVSGRSESNSCNAARGLAAQILRC
jgi:hypothetical protein